MILSIIVPVYNVEMYLNRCLNSIIIADTSKIEVIVVNDGSTDQSAQICDDYAKDHSYVKVIHKRNGGLSSARNEGLKYATGDYVAFLDSDDMVAPNFTKDMLYLINKFHPDLIDFPYCEEHILNQFTIKGNQAVKSYTQKKFIEHLLANGTGSQVCFRIYRRSIFNDIFFPEKRYYEDMFTFWRVLLKTESIISVNYTYYIYNMSNLKSITKEISVQSMIDMKDACDCMCDGLYSYCKKQKIDLTLLEYARINTYTYIGYKIRKVEENTILIEKEINTYIKNHPVNIYKFRRYNWKKYLLYRLMILFY